MLSADETFSGMIGLDAFREILGDPRLREIPTILETPSFVRNLRRDERSHAPYKEIIELERTRAWNEIVLLRSIIDTPREIGRERSEEIFNEYKHLKKNIEVKIHRILESELRKVDKGRFWWRYLENKKDIETRSKQVTQWRRRRMEEDVARAQGQERQKRVYMTLKKRRREEEGDSESEKEREQVEYKPTMRLRNGSVKDPQKAAQRRKRPRRLMIDAGEVEE